MNPTQRVSRNEWVWVASVTVVVMLATLLPYIVGVQSSTSEMQYSGFVFGIADMNTYIAKMRYGATYPGWLFEHVYTLEEHQPGILVPFHVTLGKLTAIFARDPSQIPTQVFVVVYHIARLVCGVILLFVTYRFISEFIEQVRLRRLAWFLAVCGTGLGWVSLFGSQPDFIPVFFYIPEAFTWLQIYGIPHLAFTRSLLLLGWLFMFAAMDNKSIASALIAGFCWLVMGLIVPFYVALLGVLIATWLGVQLLMWPKQFLATFRIAIVAGILPVFVLLYYGWLFTSDPILSYWSSQNQLQSPPPGHYLLAFGPYLLMFGLGVWRRTLSEMDHRWLLLLVWVPLACILIYLPINVQRRLLEAVILPLTIFGVLGIAWLVEKSPGPAFRSWTRAYAVLVVIVLPGLVILMVGGAAAVQSVRSPAFVPVDVSAGHAWLRENAQPGASVLSTFDSGNEIPAGATVRVYVGHGPETVDSDQKTLLAEHFFFSHDVLDQIEAAQQIDLDTIDYIWVGPAERLAGCDELCLDVEEFGLTQVYSNDQVAIFEVP